MGFPTNFLKTNESLVSEFICPICVALVEEPVITPCSHVFCKSCWDEWNQEYNSSQCPKCNTKQPAAYPLRNANPLAWRILSRVGIFCPLSNQSCKWSGEYSELSAHLTSNDSHHSQGSGDGASARASAEALKDQGNQRFEARAFREAIKLYSKAITIDPSVASFYTNRAAAWLMVGALEESESDCKKALSLNPNFARAHLRLSKVLCEKGDFKLATARLSEAVQSNPSEAQLADEHARMTAHLQAYEDGIKAYEGGDGLGAMQHFRSVETISSAASLKLWVAKAALLSGSCDRAITITLRIIKEDEQNAEAYAVRGSALFFSGDMDQGVKHIKESLRLDPDQGQTARTLKGLKVVHECVSKARDCANIRQFEEAQELLTQALSAVQFPATSPILATIYSERGSTRNRLKQHEDCLEDCSHALKIQDDCKDAWLTRASSLIALGKQDQARSEMSDLLKIFEHDSLVRHWYDKADFEVRKVARPDYYSILRISPVSTEGEIKAAYKARALECHPDKAAGMAEEVQKAAEAEFKRISEALEVLGSEMSRKLYDEGYDKHAIDERIAAAQRAAREGDKRHGHHHGHHH